MKQGQAFMRLALAGLLSLALASAAHARTHRHHRVHHASDELGLRSNAALILDETDSSVLYSRHADVSRPIASITKLMTSLIVLDAHQPLDEVIEITAADSITGKGHYSRVMTGMKLTRGELMHLALMSSENRAAYTLGRHYPGGLPAAVRAMNAKARELGMTTAHFADPTGLSSDNVASCEDLSKLVRAASENATIRAYSTDEDYAVKAGRRTIEFRNTNALVHNPDWDIIVQKTGYISEAGRCLVMETMIGGRKVLMVLLDSTGKATRVADARRVRKWMETKWTAQASSAVAQVGKS